MPIKIFIDQGHNPYGPNTGAVGNGVIEQDVNYNVGKFLQDFLENDYRFSVRVSRPPPLTARKFMFIPKIPPHMPWRATFCKAL